MIPISQLKSSAESAKPPVPFIPPTQGTPIQFLRMHDGSVEKASKKARNPSPKSPLHFSHLFLTRLLYSLQEKEREREREREKGGHPPHALQQQQRLQLCLHHRSRVATTIKAPISHQTLIPKQTETTTAITAPPTPPPFLHLPPPPPPPPLPRRRRRMDEVAVVPEELRCKRSDGKQWRCSAPCMPDKTVCEKHYFQAKKRAANSALRACNRLPRRRAPPSPRHDPQIDDRPVPRSLPETSFSAPPTLTCHQCRRSDRTRVVRCTACVRRGYCDTCIARWYVDFTMEELSGACPACRGICSCSVCRRGESFIKGRIREISSLEKLKYFYGLMSCVLPMLKKIHDEQCVERDLENKLYGVENDIPRARMNLDEQMCCDVCGIPIVDYHRHCVDCTADFCIDCCREVRRNVTRRDFRDLRATDRGCETLSLSLKAESYNREDDFNRIFQRSFPSWRASSDGSIRCPGDHCSSPLLLRRIFKINWVSKLAKNLEEMVNGCRFSDSDTLDKCIHCSLVSSSTSKGLSRSNLYRCSQRQSGDNHLYTPTALDIRCDGIFHFRRHWANGEPIIVRRAIDCLMGSNWDPRSISIGIIETSNDRLREDDSTVIKAMDCLTRSEVEIELEDFIRGYFERHIREDGKPRLLKSNEWPPSGALEEFLLCQRPLVFKELPLLEFIHSKWGLLNLAAKLPSDLVQTDGKPRLYVAYGSEEEQGLGDSVVDLNVNISDTVYILMHSAKVDFHDQNLAGYGTTTENSAEYLLHKSPRDRHHHRLKDGNGSSDDQYIEKVDVGAVWDVFRRQDAPKLNEYLRNHSSESWDSNISMNKVTNPLHDSTHFLHEVQKKKLKKQAGIEPWTFKQCVGEAVFVPAGCAFQLRNIKPCVQLVFNFHSPESLSESMRLAQDIRHLPNEHPAKLQMLEVGKMPLYASSWVIREIQKMILDPKVGAELGFEDRNLTEMVSDNVRRLKRSRITCK